jgi:hypothetical protein
MGGGRGLLRNGWCLAAVLVLTAPAALAETTTPRQFPTYLATPLLDHDAVALPYAAPSHRSDKAAEQVEPGKFQKNGLPAKSLDTIDLGGKSTLRLDMTETNTRAAADIPDYTNVIVPLAPGKKRETPRYFGLKLSAPTH